VEDEPTDASLVRRAQHGERDAFAALVERYQQPLGGYLWRLTRDRELASDLTQEAFLHAYRSISATPPGLLVRPWLYRIATNLAYDEFRRQRRSGRLQQRTLGQIPAEDESSLIEERELVRLALDRLRASDRAVLLLCAVEQLRYPEVGAILGCSSAGQLEATVYGWLAEAEIREVRAHAARCPKCEAALRKEENVQRQLGLLRADEPTIDVSKRIVDQLAQSVHRRLSLRSARLAVVALALVAAGLLVASNGHLRRTVRRLSAIVIT
jgi:RNA polymerase sigma-70 factor (ECF subfamily)